MYMIGIDVGGTNTDVVLLRDSKVLALAKVPTEHNDLFSSTKEALGQILTYYEGASPLGEAPIRLQLSTTLATNSIVEGRKAAVKVVTMPGPGVNLSTLGFPFPLIELSGYIDHRGREVSALEQGELENLAATIGCDCGAVAVVGKFSQRNPAQEITLGKQISQWHHGFISYGHRLSGRANFPRRIVTAYLNAAVAEAHLEFITMWEKLLEELASPIGERLILKADGGTMTFKDSKERPIETILSGPAASIMGVQALTQDRKGYAEGNYVIVDIGGTTTDLTAIVDHQILYERDGASIAQYKTLVPAVLARSLGLGGDSVITDGVEGEILIGPMRAGAPLCLGGNSLTPTDAVVALGFAELGTKARAISAFETWAEELGLNWNTLAQRVIDAFVDKIIEAIKELYLELDASPLHTVAEVLHPPERKPRRVVGLGAPAHVFIPKIAEKLGLPHEVVPYSSVANAIGAAAAQATLGLTLHADTELGLMTIPEMGFRGQIDRPLLFTLDKARQFAKEKMIEYAHERGYAEVEEVYIVEEESFPVVRGFRTVGKIHMVRTQMAPQVRSIKGGEENGC